MLIVNIHQTISLCIDYLIKSNADNVGGVVENIPHGNGFFSTGIALALSSEFGVNSNSELGFLKK